MAKASCLLGFIISMFIHPLSNAGNADDIITIVCDHPVFDERPVAFRRVKTKGVWGMEIKNLGKWQSWVGDQQLWIDGWKTWNCCEKPNRQNCSIDIYKTTAFCNYETNGQSYMTAVDFYQADYQLIVDRNLDPIVHVQCLHVF